MPIAIIPKIKLFNLILIWKNRMLKINTKNQNNLLFNVKSADNEKVHKNTCDTILCQSNAWDNIQGCTKHE